jgi:ubiquinone/menaquinone biosynthesis C-methylase UbiE
MSKLEKRWAKSRTIEFAVEDATQLSFPDESFDRVTCISAIEHVPNGGDSAVASEIGRVLRSGGVAVLTFPSANIGYDIWRNDNAVMQKYGAPRIFWAHVYCYNDVMHRIVEPSGLVLDEMQLVGDTRFHFEKWYRKLGRANVMIRPLLPLIAGLFLRDLCWRDLPDDQPNPHTCLVKLRKV